MSSHIFEYSRQYNANLLRGKDVSVRPKLVHDMAVEWGDAHKELLDIGCGTAQKTLRLAGSYKRVIGLEPSPDLLNIAQNNIPTHKINNLQLVKGTAESLPFKNKEFDSVIAVLTWWSAPEVARVLKPDGLFLIECLGNEDKITFTKFFGKDERGWRGGGLNTNSTQLQQQLKNQLNPYFEILEIKNLHWQTSYCKEGLQLLLENTYSTVRNFDIVCDKNYFDQAIAALQVNDEIILTQNRLMVVARKKTSILSA